MAFNGAGGFSLVAGNPVVTGTVISSTWANNTLSDIANNGLSLCLTKDGQQTPTNNIPLGGFRLTGVGNAVNAQDAVPAAQLQSGALILLGAIGGTGDAITATTSPAITAYAAGEKFVYIPTASNTLKNPTINISGLGAKTITTSLGGPLLAGALIVGVPYELLYDGTNMRIQTGQTGSVRTKLTNNQTFFVSTSGNDSNDGLSSGTAWLTLQKAWGYIQQNLDLAGFTVTVSVAAGTYAAMIASGVVPGVTTNTSIQFIGTASIITSSSAAAAVFCQNGAVLSISGFTISNSASGSSGVAVIHPGSMLTLGSGMAFGSSPNHILVQDRGYVNVTATYSITSGAVGAHYTATTYGRIVLNPGITIGISGTQGFGGSFAASNSQGQIIAGSCTFTGTATGTRYVADTLSFINVSGGGATYFPGSVAGTTANNALYL